MPKKKNWQNSEAKKLLLQDLRSGLITLDTKMTPMEVYCQRPEFAEFGGYKNFPSRLRSARQQISSKNDRCVSDSDALAHDRRIYPKAATNYRGEPRWEGSEAERLLRHDMDEGQHEMMTPMMFWESRNEYKDNYTSEVFRQHIYQEAKRRKFLAQYGCSRNNNS